MPWGLLLNRYVFGALALIALFVLLVQEKSRYDDRRREEGAAPYITAIAKQKAAATAELSAKIAENVAREEADRLRSITNQKDYDDVLKKLTVDRDKYRADGLRFQADRRGVCGDSAGGQASSSAGATEAVSVEVRIPDAIGADLRKLADDADELAAWGKSCFAFVNGK